MTWARSFLGTLFYWTVALILVARFSTVPCLPATDCKTPALELFWRNLALAAGLYAIIAAALFVAFHLARKGRN